MREMLKTVARSAKSGLHVASFAQNPNSGVKILYVNNYNLDV